MKNVSTECAEEIPGHSRNRYVSYYVFALSSLAASAVVAVDSCERSGGRQRFSLFIFFHYTESPFIVSFS